MAKTYTVTEVEVRHLVTIKDGTEVVGSAEIIKTSLGRAELLLAQTYGGSTEGRLKTPVKADVEVLRKMIEAADSLPTP